MNHRLVVYSSPWCINCLDTQEALKEWQVDYVNVDIKEDKGGRPSACERGRVSKACRLWSSPETTAWSPSRSRRRWCRAPAAGGVDRGTMLTEPTRKELHAWLVRHGILEN